ncbi:RluA family pseudouridine synthase [Pontiella sulfatireligans]|uniref:tRNA pseudouridine synthase C n=1 Tax=Pontiella sulfatireligans TaxID=2750658 RepID=A0A6C2USU4_9BACT|nr:RNA pseudouridine synthase [Pontiella sulfatireligans]VGO23338.1 tRNA pseudouridine synthase C [Pontiella sulfatireligans]
MQNKKPFKQPSKKYHPKGLEILYEDWDILVVNKTNGLLTVSTETERQKTAQYLLNEYVRKGNSKSSARVYVVHRLDRDTSGVLVFAKSEKVKRFFQREWTNFTKIYYAVVCGTLKEKSGKITSYLVENSAQKMYSVSDPEKGKLAQTLYKVLKESAKYSLLEVRLLTGRKNQIRVHMADQGCPVAGDTKYGRQRNSAKRLCLHATSLSIVHPFSKEPMTFETEMPAYFNTLMK